MPTEVLDGNSIRKASKVAKDGGDLMLRDKSAAGLAIRVQKGGASWYFITRERKIVIGRLDAFAADDISELRNIVTRARSMLAEGNDPTAMLKATVVHRKTEAASAQAAATSGSVMRWETMRDAYLAWAELHKAPDTYRGYRSALGAIPGSPLAVDFAGIAGRPLPLIETHDLRLVRNAILDRGKVDGKQTSKQNQARLTVAALKAAFSWAVEHFDQTGITKSPASELSPAPASAPHPFAKGAKETEEAAAPRALTLLELGMLVIGLDQVDNHPARLGLLLQLMTGQRRMTVARAKRNAFAMHDEYGMLWKVSPDKSGKFRLLPLPDLAASAVRGLIEAGRSTDEWLLPQQRLRRNGDAGGGHIAERTLSDVLLTLRTPGGPLSSAPWVATHDLRRAFVTHMRPRVKSLGLDDDAVPMITRADEGRYGLDETVYDQDPALPAKFAMLTEWDRLVKEGCVQAERLLTAAR